MVEEAARRSSMKMDGWAGRAWPNISAGHALRSPSGSPGLRSVICRPVWAPASTQYHRPRLVILDEIVNSAEPHHVLVKRGGAGAPVSPPVISAARPAWQP